jgi:hypothetical protein
MEDTTSGTVEIELDGRRYVGRYTLTGGKVPIVWVSASTPPVPGYRPAEVEDGPVDRVAETVLREIIVDARAKGWIE